MPTPAMTQWLAHAAPWLERYRITSQDRTVAENNAAGGASSSSHLTGEATDLVPLDGNTHDVYLSLKEADRRGELLPWDQIIFYPGHVHVGVGPKLRREWRVSVGGSYPFASPDTLATLPAPSKVRVPLLVFVSGALVLLGATIYLGRRA